MAQIRERLWKHLVQRQANRQGEIVTPSDDDAQLAFQLEVGPQEGRAPAEVEVLEAGVTHFIYDCWCEPALLEMHNISLGNP